jgi:hypothetical protein
LLNENLTVGYKNPYALILIHKVDNLETLLPLGNGVSFYYKLNPLVTVFIPCNCALITPPATAPNKLRTICHFIAPHVSGVITKLLLLFFRNPKGQGSLKILQGLFS